MKFLIADDHELFLKGLELLLSDFSQNIELVKAKNYLEVLDIVKKQKDFDLIITDLAMPGMKWNEAIKQIYQTLPNTPIIIISAILDNNIIRQTIDIGVSGYIQKTASNNTIINAINLVLSGGAYIPSEMWDQAFQNDFLDLKELANTNQKGIKLTPRQTDVLKLVAKGLANKNIAYELGLSEGTIKLYVTAILKILNVNNRTGAVGEAKKIGLI